MSVSFCTIAIAMVQSSIPNWRVLVLAMIRRRKTSIARVIPTSPVTETDLVRSRCGSPHIVSLMFLVTLKISPALHKKGARQTESVSNWATEVDAWLKDTNLHRVIASTCGTLYGDGRLTHALYLSSLVAERLMVMQDLRHIQVEWSIKSTWGLLMLPQRQPISVFASFGRVK